MTCEATNLKAGRWKPEDGSCNQHIPYYSQTLKLPNPHPETRNPKPAPKFSASSNFPINYLILQHDFQTDH